MKIAKVKFNIPNKKRPGEYVGKYNRLIVLPRFKVTTPSELEVALEDRLRYYFAYKINKYYEGDYSKFTNLINIYLVYEANNKVIKREVVDKIDIFKDTTCSILYKYDIINRDEVLKKIKEDLKEIEKNNKLYEYEEELYNYIDQKLEEYAKNVELEITDNIMPIKVTHEIVSGPAMYGEYPGGSVYTVFEGGLEVSGEVLPEGTHNLRVREYYYDNKLLVKAIQLPSKEWIYRRYDNKIMMYNTYQTDNIEKIDKFAKREAMYLKYINGWNLLKEKLKQYGVELWDDFDDPVGEGECGITINNENINLNKIKKLIDNLLK